MRHKEDEMMDRSTWLPWAGVPESYKISIAELVQNGTMDANIAGTLWAAVDEQLSFLTVAVPQNAGKTTVASAVLALRPPSVDLHFIYAERTELEALAQAKHGGYLVVGEFSRYQMPSYIWGDSVRQVFSTLRHGYSLQTSLHAPGVEPAIRVITSENRVSDAEASALKLVVYIGVHRARAGGVIRRVEEVYELDRVEAGLPVGRTLFRWQAHDDTFEKVSEPELFGQDRELLNRRRQVIGNLVAKGSVSTSHVAEAVSAFRDASR
jgi:hypothetical protein